MCGIAGFVGAGSRSDLEAMTRALAHRGPDGAGYFVDEARPVCLGHRRLAILDLAGGPQPMWNEDGRVGVVFNGEIYNHAELRSALEARGHHFKSSHCDTEVLVHGYEEWGVDLPGRLHGMFAFAVYDRAGGQLFLARDHFGKKPLFYAHRDGFFAFASELNALAQHPLIDRTLEPRSLRKFLAYGFLPAPNALYRGVHKLPGGHWLRFDVDRGELSKGCYWRFRIEPRDELAQRDEEELAEELEHLLSRAVKRRLMSDVPLGIFLSGGLDSSAVLALAARHTPKEKIQTFSLGFFEKSYDESKYARRAASWIGVRPHEAFLDLEKAKAIVPHLLGRLDEPLGDPSLVPTYLLASFARKHITVALGGDGGDELFAGYDPFRALRWAHLYARWIPRAVHPALRQLAFWLPVSRRNMSFDYRLRRFLGGLSYPKNCWNPVWLGPLEPAELAELFQEPIDPEELYSEAIQVWDEGGSTNLVDRTSEFFTRLYLQDDILVKADRASMLNSLELRSPFLDRDVVRFACSLPAHFKLRGSTTKYLLRRMLKRLLPPDLIARPKKGFGIPLSRWLCQWPAQMTNLALTPLPQAEVSRRWSEHRHGVGDHRLFLWCCMTLAQHVLGTPEMAAAA
jgi:asparagine synthase (glutamine-hydrolysing)